MARVVPAQERRGVMARLNGVGGATVPLGTRGGSGSVPLVSHSMVCAEARSAGPERQLRQSCGNERLEAQDRGRDVGQPEQAARQHLQLARDRLRLRVVDRCRQDWRVVE